MMQDCTPLKVTFPSTHGSRLIRPKRPSNSLWIPQLQETRRVFGEYRGCNARVDAQVYSRPGACSGNLRLARTRRCCTAGRADPSAIRFCHSLKSCPPCLPPLGWFAGSPRCCGRRPKDPWLGHMRRRTGDVIESLQRLAAIAHVQYITRLQSRGRRWSCLYTLLTWRCSATSARLNVATRWVSEIWSILLENLESECHDVSCW